MSDNGNNNQVRKVSTGSKKKNNIAEKATDFAKKIGSKVSKYAPAGALLIAVILVIYIIIFITLSVEFAKKYTGVCIEADDFGTRGNGIPAYARNVDTDFTINRGYIHEEYTQRLEPVDLKLTFNGEPLIINITGQWRPWLVNMKKERYITEDTLPYDAFYTLDSRFLCALEKYDAGSFYNAKPDENEFYYIKNYFSDIQEYTNETGNDIEVFGKTVKDGGKILVGVEKAPEKQKDCWITRGAGLYLASTGLTGRSEPTSYHHLIAGKLFCAKKNWFGGANYENKDTILKYNRPTSINWGSCTNLGNSGEKISCSSPGADSSFYIRRDVIRGLCFKVQANNLTTVYDCKQYTSTPYTYEDFRKNYFDLNQHKPDRPSNHNDILEENEFEVIFNIERYEDQLIEAGVKNYGNIIATSMEKFMSACFEETKDADGNTERIPKSYFQYGPKTLYKNSMTGLNNETYEYGEKMIMIILDKYYSDNTGEYEIEIVSGINLDELNGIEGKLKEVEYFLLGTPQPGLDSDREDGVVAKAFMNIINSDFGLVVRIALCFVVLFYGFKVIFGIKDLKEGSTEHEDLIDKKYLFKTLIKIAVLLAFIEPDGFLLFNRLVIGFFINGTIGLVDLISSSFDNSFIGAGSSALSAGLQNVDNSLSLAGNFALIDEIIAFFDSNSLMIKTMSFFLNFGDYFLFGAFISVALLLIIVYYLYVVLYSVVPFVSVLLQFAVLLPLAPIFLLLYLFKQTSDYFKEWIKKILSLCIELVAFFTAFYFYTTIINNIIKELLSFKVCFKGLGDYLFPEVDNTISVDSVSDFVNMNWLQEAIKTLLNNFVTVEQQGIPDSFFFDYILKIVTAFILIHLFNTITTAIMALVSSMIHIDGASGSSSEMKLEHNETFGTKAFDFADQTGLTTMQNESDGLKWTRNLLNLSKERDEKGAEKRNQGVLSNFVTGHLKKAGKATFGFARITSSLMSKKGKGDPSDEDPYVRKEGESREHYASSAFKHWAKDALYNNILGADFLENKNGSENILNAVTGGAYENLSRNSKDWVFKDKPDEAAEENKKKELPEIIDLENAKNSEINKFFRKKFGDNADKIANILDSTNSQIRTLREMLESMDNRRFTLRDPNGNERELTKEEAERLIKASINALEMARNEYFDEANNINSDKDNTYDHVYIDDFLNRTENLNNSQGQITVKEEEGNSSLIKATSTNLLTATNTNLQSQDAGSLVVAVNDTIVNSATN